MALMQPRELNLFLHLGYPHSWVKKGIDEVQAYVRDENHYRDDHRDCQDDGDVRGCSGHDELIAQARPRECGLQSRRASEERTECQPDDRDHRGYRVLERVLVRDG